MTAPARATLRAAWLAAALGALHAPAGAQLLCTMPNGVTITKNIGDCPADATLVRKPGGEVVRTAPLKPQVQARPPATPAPKQAAANPPPQPAKPQPTDFDFAHLACKAFRDSGASECTVDSSIFSTSYINTTLATAPHQALVICKDVAATMRQATRAFQNKAWEIRIYHPFSGNRPTASCPL